MTRPTTKPIGTTKQKQNRPAKNIANKKAKKTWAFFLKSVGFLSLSFAGIEGFLID